MAQASGARSTSEREQERGAPTYPALWNHDADRERCFIVAPDSRGMVRQGAHEKAAAIWDRTASRLHHNRNFRLNSQSLAVCLTPKPSLGGAAWPNLIPHQEGCEKALAVWGNSTLGLMLFWWQGTRQQAGRAILTITKIPELLSLDVSALERSQQTALGAVFARFRERPFLPANEAWRDETRKALDRELFHILGLPEKSLAALDLARRKWCLEPSVHGGKNTRPMNS